MTEYKNFLLDFAKKAALTIKKNFRLGMEKTNKDDGSPVTATDLLINRQLIRAVKKHFPGHGVLAEEERYDVPNAEFVWVCDPIDGTIPFSHGIPLATFTMALVKNGQPVLGIIVDPFQKNYFFAEKNTGAFLNDKPIRVNENTNLRSAVVAIEQWQQALYNVLPMIEALEKLDCHVPVLKSIAYSAALVAAGELAGAILPGENPWDLAAAKLIAEEAGGKVTDFSGNEQRYDRPINGCLVSNGVVHHQLLDSIKNNTIKN